ncbi:MAG: thioredoxin domain-containing protein [Pseudomonadales bacterium]|nr:thioredoxin domain-containing protein [Pseudomonadales bacterium]
MTTREPNRLINEASPYLIQHAYNPVDWYPWGDEAFEKARALDKPVFLSIGYSTCHWCHVMEHESFDDEGIAALLNEHFVSIKLDREQYPDLDDVYMTGVQMMTGQGGWPMSNFLTPEGKPFYAGTYFPPANFRSVLEQIARLWVERRQDVLSQAEEISTGIARYTAAKSEMRELPAELVPAAVAEALGRFDDANGGFGGAPKFPNECMLLALVDDVERRGNPEAQRALTLTLDKMYRGGICDQVAGGFHRYTVDAVWLVPHFEKMLYNQAQLLPIYARMAALTANDSWRRVAMQIAGYVLRDLAAPDGAFYSATDADSEGHEGKFFLWTPEEVLRALDADGAAFASDVYGISAEGNFEGSNILTLPDGFDALADRYGCTRETLFARVDAVNRRLYDARETRVHPLRDEKVITGWNGMMIKSLALAGFELDQPPLIDAAVLAAESVFGAAFDEQTGDLMRIRFRDASSIDGNLEDYAALAEACLTLHAVTGNEIWHVRGRLLVDAMLARFYDDEGGGFFLATGAGQGPRITRPKSPMDGATASGNSLALSCLVMLAQTSGDRSIEQKIGETISAFAGLLRASPSAFCYLASAVDRYRAGQLGPVQFAGDGNIRVLSKRKGRGVTLEIDIADGWHIGGPSVPDGEVFLPTRIEASGRVSWPDAAAGRYEGRVEIGIEGDVDVALVTLQPCSGEVCLAPQALRFVLRR